ncbi:MAG: restriction endonuclease subunit S [bacterium]
MERYKKYKDSGVEWIGEIPEEWEVEQLKYLVNILNGYSPEQCEPLSFGETEYVKVDNLNPVNFEIREGYEFVEYKYFVVKNNAILFPKRGAAIGLNKVGIVDRPISFDTNLMALEISDSQLLVDYLAYTIKNYSLISIADTSTIPQINNKHIAPFEVPYPTFEDQTAIVNYLDRKTAEIDDLIAQKEELLKLYEEEKTAVINHAVTKGINPDVKLKDSGIEWIGEIPEHWEIRRLGYSFKVIGSGTTPKTSNQNYYNGDNNWLITGDLNDGLIDKTSRKISHEAIKNSQH